MMPEDQKRIVSPIKMNGIPATRDHFPGEEMKRKHIPSMVEKNILFLLAH
jgi:hypothetical protein